MKVENCRFEITLHNPVETSYGGINLAEDKWGINYLLPLGEIMQEVKDEGFLPLSIYPKVILPLFCAQHFEDFQNSFKIVFSKYSPIGEIIQDVTLDTLYNGGAAWDSVELKSFKLGHLQLSLKLPPEALMRKLRDSSPVYGFNP